MHTYVNKLLIKFKRCDKTFMYSYLKINKKELKYINENILMIFFQSSVFNGMKNGYMQDIH